MLSEMILYMTWIRRIFVVSEQKLFFDTDCLSAFLWVDEQAILPQLYPGRIVIPEPVYQELSRPQVSHLKRRIDILVKNKQVRIIPIEYSQHSYLMYLQMISSPEKGKKIIGKGEASALALAFENDGIVASNNLKDIIQYIDDYNLLYMTTGDILIEAYAKGIITEDEGNKIWSDMLNRRRKLGAYSFSEYLSEHGRK